LHAAIADAYQSFVYLEIGSYLGGSLQVLMRDPRCRTVLSIDPRLTHAPDKRSGTWTYEDNSTQHMTHLLGELPSVDLTKLVTFETSTEALTTKKLPDRPSYCFIDGEHTDDAVLRDARFCASALDGEGVIAFHDAAMLQQAICTFVRDYWQDISFALAFTGEVFAIEFGGLGLLRSAAVTRAVASRWHSAVWTAANRWRPSARPLLKTWSMMPSVDRTILDWKTRLRAGQGSHNLAGSL
jgi:methyltransferase family protein